MCHDRGIVTADFVVSFTVRLFCSRYQHCFEVGYFLAKKHISNNHKQLYADLLDGS